MLDAFCQCPLSVCMRTIEAFYKNILMPSNGKKYLCFLGLEMAWQRWSYHWNVGLTLPPNNVAFKHNAKERPNYGKEVGMDPTAWWSSVSGTISLLPS